MGYTFAAVEKTSKQFGKIIDDKNKRFTVLWSTGDVSETGQPDAVKVILNSPTFFSLVQPERNQEIFESNPAQLIREILWEKRCLAAAPQTKKHSRPGAQSTSTLKGIVLSLGIPASTWEKSWTKLRKELTAADSGVGFDGPEFWLASPNLEIFGEIMVDWDALLSSKKKSHTTAENGATKQAEGASDFESASMPKLKNKHVLPKQESPSDQWSVFVSMLEKRVGEAPNLETNASEFLHLFLGLQKTFALLDDESTTKIKSSLGRTGSAEAFLLASMLTKTPLEQKKKTGQSAQTLALGVLEKSSADADSLSVIERVALARLALCVGSFTSINISDSDFSLVCSLIFSLTSPDLIAVKESAVQELAKRIISSPAGSVQGVSKVLASLPWGSAMRQPLVEALLKQSAPETRTYDFWVGLDLNSIQMLSALPIWKPIINRPSIRDLIQTALEKSLSSISPKDCLAALSHLDTIGPVLGQDAIDSLVLSALQANPLTQNSLATLSRVSEIAKVQDELKKANFMTIEAQRRADESGKRVAELLAQVESLSDKVLAAGDRVGKLRESERLQYELDAAKTLARVLTILDNELGPGYQGRDRVIAQGGRLGISQIFETGEEKVYAPATCDDPEDKAGEGDSVKIIASGFKWTAGDQSVVLVKALVVKI